MPGKIDQNRVKPSNRQVFLCWGGQGRRGKGMIGRGMRGRGMRKNNNALSLFPTRPSSHSPASHSSAFSGAAQEKDGRQKTEAIQFLVFK
jgi:hypothetical protein